MSKSLKKILITGASLLMMASLGTGINNVNAKVRHYHHTRKTLVINKKYSKKHLRKNFKKVRQSRHYKVSANKEFNLGVKIGVDQFHNNVVHPTLSNRNLYRNFQELTKNKNVLNDNFDKGFLKAIHDDSIIMADHPSVDFTSDLIIHSYRLLNSARAYVKGNKSTKRFVKKYLFNKRFGNHLSNKENKRYDRLTHTNADVYDELAQYEYLFETNHHAKYAKKLMNKVIKPQYFKLAKQYKLSGYMNKQVIKVDGNFAH